MREETEGERKAWAAVVRARAAYVAYQTEEALQALDFALNEWQYQRGKTAWQRVRGGVYQEQRKVGSDA